MHQFVFDELATFSTEKHTHVRLVAEERLKVILLCLAPGQAVPPHAHPGFTVTLQPLKGRAVLPQPDGSTMDLAPGRILVVEGESFFGPSNPTNENCEVLIHLIKR